MILLGYDLVLMGGGGRAGLVFFFSIFWMPESFTSIPTDASMFRVNVRGVPGVMGMVGVLGIDGCGVWGRWMFSERTEEKRY